MPASTPPSSRIRLDFLHGMRGLAALYIMLFHATLNARVPTGSIADRISAPLLHGQLAVAVFLVLSGFLLATPAVRDGLVLRGGVLAFLRRRAVRILPPYYAAYILYMIFFAGAAWLGAVTGRDPGGAVHEQMRIGYGSSSVIAHVFLVHNMRADWIAGMNAMLWTIACEWQIYLLFALALLPLWRRAGIWAMLAACLVTAALGIEGCERGIMTYQLPWMIAIFGLGALAALVVFGDSSFAECARRWNWGRITLGCAGLLVAGVVSLDRALPVALPEEGIRIPYYLWSYRVRWMYDALAAFASASCIVWIALNGHQERGPAAVAARARALLESRPLLTLGLFAYSLYLTHGMAIVFVARATVILWPYPALHSAVSMASTTAISLTLAYGFYLYVERYSMSSETRRMFERRPAAGHP